MLILPAFAFANEIIPVFSRKAIFGYPAVVAASVGIGFISLSLGSPNVYGWHGGGANTFFTLATMIIGVPTGIKIFQLARHYPGRRISDQHFQVFAINCVHLGSSAHMVEHLLLVSVVPPLLLCGLTVVPLLRGLPAWFTRRVVGALIGFPPFRHLGEWLVTPLIAWFTLNLSFLGGTSPVRMTSHSSMRPGTT